MDPHGTDTNPPPTTSHPLRMPAALKSRTYGQYLMSDDPARQIRGGGAGAGETCCILSEKNLRLNISRNVHVPCN